MKTTLVHVHVMPEHVEAFVEATRLNHEGSIQEPGNIRFDVLQQVDDPSFFTLVEQFRDDEALQAHRETEHYLAWRETVKDWMAEPRKGVPYSQLQP